MAAPAVILFVTCASAGVAVWQSGVSNAQRPQQLLHRGGSDAKQQPRRDDVAADASSRDSEVLIGYSPLGTSSPHGWAAAEDQASALRLTFNGDYPALATLELYGFDHLAEPFRNTTLVAQNDGGGGGGGGGGSGAVYMWTVYTQSGEIDGQYSGIEATHIFTRVPETYSVSLLEVDDSGSVVRSVSGNVTCKYVRRDTHRMNDEDRERFTTALRLMYDLEGPAGREIFGPKYVSIHEVNIMHLDRFTQLHCTPWHDGDIFITAHQAFLLWLEQSLQAIDPRISFPYWDFTYEAAMGEDWSHSPMFSAAWFGSYGTEETSFAVPDGVFAGAEIPTDCGKPEKNSYCRLTSSFNNDATRVLTRANSVCGMKTTVGFPTCELLREVLAPANYTESATLLGANLHSQLHMQLGGSWDCPFGIDLAMALSPDNAELQRFIEYAAVENNVVVLSNMVINDVMKCPEACEEGTPFEECLCYCPQMHKDLEAGMSLFNASWNILEAAGLIDSDMFDAGSFAAALASLPTEEAREALVIWFAGFACSPGKLFPFSSLFGSAMDPIFGPTHAYYDYIMQGKMLLGGEESMTLDWDNTQNCWAHEWLAQLPFHDFEDEHNKQYTNQELQRFFRPNDPSLPYVYDDYSFQHCGKVHEPAKLSLRSPCSKSKEQDAALLTRSRL